MCRNVRSGRKGVETFLGMSRAALTMVTSKTQEDKQCSSRKTFFSVCLVLHKDVSRTHINMLPLGAVQHVKGRKRHPTRVLLCIPLKLQKKARWKEEERPAEHSFPSQVWKVCPSKVVVICLFAAVALSTSGRDASHTEKTQTLRDVCPSPT